MNKYALVSKIPFVVNNNNDEKRIIKFRTKKYSEKE
jgi:hypothetical protein